MRIVTTSLLAVAMMVLSAPLADAAAKSPNYNCGKVGRDCVAACDSKAEKARLAKEYDKCLAACDKKEAACSDRQDTAAGCGKVFESCIKKAQSEKDKEPCRAAYKTCKGD